MVRKSHGATSCGDATCWCRPPKLVFGTPDELKAMAALKKLAESWPESLWLFSADGGLYVMKKGHGERVMRTDDPGVDSDYILGQKINIASDGGDW